MPHRTSNGSTPRASRVRHAPGVARELILRAAVRHLSKRPFRALSVGALMAGTPLSRPAFYWHFRDLYELMEALLGRVGDGVQARANPWLAGIGEPTAALHESLRGLVEVGVEFGGVLRAVTEAVPTDDRLERAWRQFMAFWGEAVAVRIAAQQATGVVAPGDVRALADALNALDVAVLVQAFGRRPHADREVVLATLHRIWFGALYATSPSVGPTRSTRSRRRTARE